MNALIIVAAIAGIPVVSALIFRVNSALVFLSLAAGLLIIDGIGDDAGIAVSSMARSRDVSNYTDIALLLLPVVLTLLFARGSLPKSKAFLHIVPLIATGAALGLLAVDYLPNHIQDQFYGTQIGDALRPAQGVALAAVAVLNLILAWISFHGSGRRKHH